MSGKRGRINTLLLYARALRHLRMRQVLGRMRGVHARRAVPDAPEVPRDWNAESLAWLRAHLAARAELLGIADAAPPTEAVFLGQSAPLNFGSPWHDAARPLLWRYQLHGFRHMDVLLAPGGAHGAALLAEMHDWIKHNPPGSRPGWDPYPLSCRLIHWVSAEACYGFGDAEMRRSAQQQAEYLARNIEYGVDGNHLLKNAVALVLYEAATRPWEYAWERASRLLRQELRQQVLQDGMHYERSPMYHALVLDDLLLVYAVLSGFDLADPKLSPHAMADALATVCHPDGELALFGDAALGEAMPARTLVQLAGASWWLVEAPSPHPSPRGRGSGAEDGSRVRSPSQGSGRQAKAPSPHPSPRGRGSQSEDGSRVRSPSQGRGGQVEGPSPLTFPEGGGSQAEDSPSQALPDAGFYVLRPAGTGHHLIAKAGAPGPAHQLGHAHCVPLSFELSVGTLRIVVDSGTHGYAESPLRAYCRSVRAHNTVCVNGHEPLECWGTFRVARRYKPAKVRLHIESLEHRTQGLNLPAELRVGEFCALRASYCGYQGYEHARDIAWRDGAWRIVDTVTDRGRIDAESYLHFHPECRVRRHEDGKTFLVEREDVHLVVRPLHVERRKLVAGQEYPAQGWYCPRFGEALPAPTIILHASGNGRVLFGYDILPFHP